MRVILVYRDPSEYATTVDEFLREFTVRTGKTARTNGPRFS